MTDMSEVSASVDYANRQFVTRDGTRLTLKPIPKMVLERLYNNNDGKPKVPVVDVVLGGTYTAKESNPEDPAYKAALDKWTSDKNLGLARYLILNGIAEPTPEAFADEYREYAPAISERDLKYLWVLSLLGDDDDTQTDGLRLLTEALFGQTAPTEKGMQQAEESFRGNGRGDTAEPVPDGAGVGERDV